MSETSDQTLQHALDRMVANSVRPVVGILSLLYGFFAVSHLVVLPSPQRETMAGLAALLALLFGSVYLWLSNRPLPASWGHPAAAGLAGVVLCNAFMHLALVGEARNTTNLILVLVGLGALLLSLRWLSALLIGSLFVWLLLAPLPAPFRRLVALWFRAPVGVGLVGVDSHCALPGT